MSSMKGRIKFNKIRNKSERIKKRLSKKSGEKTDKPKKTKNKKKFWVTILSIITICAIIAILCVIAFGAYIVLNAPEFNEELLYNKDELEVAHQQYIYP